jgi:hypothetical protein
MAWSFHERKWRTGRQNSLEAAVDWATFLREDLQRLSYRRWPWAPMFDAAPAFSELAAELEEVPPVQAALGLDDAADRQATTQEATRRVRADWHRGIKRGYFRPWGRLQDHRRGS